MRRTFDTFIAREFPKVTWDQFIAELKSLNDVVSALPARMPLEPVVTSQVVVKLSYHPQMALLESIFVRDFKDEYLAQEYQVLTGQVMQLKPEHERIDAQKLMDSWKLETPERGELWQNAIRSADVYWPFFQLLAMQTASHNRDIEDPDFVILDRTFRLQAEAKENPDYEMLTLWGDTLGQWCLKTHDPVLRSLRLQAALQKYSLVLNGKAPPRVRATVLYNRGVTYGQLGDSQQEIADYSAVLEMPDAPAEQKASAFGNRGWQYYELGQLEPAIADHREAISRMPNKCTYHGNLAVALLVSGQLEDAVRAYDRSLELAKTSDIADIERDLSAALEKHVAIEGAETVLDRLAARRRELEATSGDNQTESDH